MAARWTTRQYFALSLPNEPGELARFTDRLGKAGINLVGLWGDASGGQPHLSVVPADPEAFKAFARESEVAFEEGRTFYRSGDDRPGALIETLQKIADAGINIDAIETVGTGERFGCFIWAEEGKWDQLAKLLT